MLAYFLGGEIDNKDDLKRENRVSAVFLLVAPLRIPTELTERGRASKGPLAGV